MNMSSPLIDLLLRKRIIVTCGAGGVGKTTISATLAIAAARMGKKVLVVTIDPSKRLAETLGVARNPPQPVSLPPERLAEVGVAAPGSLEAWMLDPQLIADGVVRRFSHTPEQAEQLLQNRIYRNVTAMVAGMQEYTAVEALHQFIVGERYDLIVLDTPPSRNALNFLAAPGRVEKFMDGRVFKYFLPSNESFMARAASKIVITVMDGAFGEDARTELMSFFGLFSSILTRLSSNAQDMRRVFHNPSAAFIVVTSPAHEALTEARYFEHRTRDQLHLPLTGYLLNRSFAADAQYPFPDSSYFAHSELSQASIDNFQSMAQLEQTTVDQHRALLQEIAERVGKKVFVTALPQIGDGVSDLLALNELVDRICA
jgi:anion-transporting  ArsA/GET3 family ATPase